MIIRLALAMVLLPFTHQAWAHRLDEYLQATLVDLEPGSIRLRINLTPGVRVAGQVLASIDRDHDGIISTNEAAAYSELVRRELIVRLDGRELNFKLTRSYFPGVPELKTGWAFIQVEYSAATRTITSGRHTITFENRHFIGFSVYLLNATQPQSKSIEITRQTRNETQSVGEIEFAFHAQSNFPPAGTCAPPRVALLVAVLAGLVIARFAVNQPAASRVSVFRPTISSQRGSSAGPQNL
jgi:hypothetical protein